MAAGKTSSGKGKESKLAAFLREKADKVRSDTSEAGKDAGRKPNTSSARSAADAIRAAAVTATSRASAKESPVAAMIRNEADQVNKGTPGKGYGVMAAVENVARENAEASKTPKVTGAMGGKSTTKVVSESPRLPEQNNKESKETTDQKNPYSENTWAKYAEVPVRMFGDIVNLLDTASTLNQGAAWKAGKKYAEVKTGSPYLADSIYNVANDLDRISKEGATQIQALTDDVGQSLYQNALTYVGAAASGMPYLPLIISGAQAAGSQMKQARDSGADENQQLISGTAAAMIEIATEKLPLDWLIDIAKGAGGKRAVVNMLSTVFKQSGLEAATEGINYLANTVTQKAILGDKAPDFDWGQLLQNTLLAGLSGGVFGGVAIGVGKMRGAKSGSAQIYTESQIPGQSSNVESAKGTQLDTQVQEPAVRLSTSIAESGEPAVRLTVGNRLGESDGPAVRMGAPMPEGYQWAGNALERVPASMIEIMNRRNAGEIVDGNGKIDHNKERTDGGEAWKDDVRTEGAGNVWYKADGSLNMPPNYGAVAGTEKIIDLQPGSKLGRFGTYGKSSDFVTAPGSAAESLSLPPYTDTSIYQEFTVLKPIPGVTQSTVAPWGGSAGGGMQYRLPMTIQDLIFNGYIK